MTRSACAFAVVLWSSLLAGCNSKSAQYAARLDASISSVATAEAVVHAWATNRVPSSFAERSLGETRQTLASNGEMDAVAVLSALDEAIRRRARGSLSEPLAALRVARQKLEDRRRTLERQP